MKIVHIEDFFHPDAGYQINILPKYLGQFGYEQVIITAEMDKIPEELTSFFGREDMEARDAAYEKNGVKIIRLPLISFVSGRAVFTSELFRTIQSEKPDVLYIHGNDTLTGIRLFKKFKKLGCAIVTDSHMLEMASKNRYNIYFRKWYKTFITPILVKNKIPVIRTQNDTYVEKCLGIPLSQSPWISYGTDTLLFHRNADVRRAFRFENDISEDDMVFLYTGKLIESKGGKLLAEAFCKKFVGEKNVVLVIVGSTSTDAYGKEVEKLLAKSENRVICFPTQKYTSLPKFYQSADVSVFSKQCSLSFYDAQGCGLPVISEGNNINIERNSHGNGLCFASDDVKDFRLKIQRVLNMSREDFYCMSSSAYAFITESYNYENKAREYEAIILGEYQRMKKERAT